MIKYIEYYYKLNAKNLNFDGKYCTFVSGGKHYALFECNMSMIESYRQNISSLINTVYFKLVTNRYGKYLSQIEERCYALMEAGQFRNRQLNYKDILNVYTCQHKLYTSTCPYTNLKSKIYDFDTVKFLIKMWELKIDEIEKYASEKCELMARYGEIIDYYVGWAELAAGYFKHIDFDDNMCSALENDVCLQHMRVSIMDTIYDYLNPCNLKLDYDVRDIAEYLKSSIISETFEIEMFETIIEELKLRRVQLKVLYARMLFPSFFFDEFETKISREDFDIGTNATFSKSVMYEKSLRDVSFVLYKKYNIDVIPWLLNE